RLGEGIEAIVEETAQEAAAATPAPPAPVQGEEAPQGRPGLMGRLLGRAEKPDAPRRVLDDAMLESLEELLIQSDMGVETAVRVTANLAEGRMGRRLSVEEIRELLAGEIARIMEP